MGLTRLRLKKVTLCMGRAKKEERKKGNALGRRESRKQKGKNRKHGKDKDNLCTPPKAYYNARLRTPGTSGL